MNRKIKGLIISIIAIMLIIFLGLYNKSNAVDIGNATQVTASTGAGATLCAGDGVNAPNDTFCVYHGPLVAGLYNVVNHIHIDGLQSDTFGQNLTLNENGIFGWILAQGDNTPYITSHTAQLCRYSDKQMAVYGYFGAWRDANGFSFPTNTGTDTNTAWIAAGQDYVNNNYGAATQASISDNTNTSKIQIDTRKIDSGEYIQVGPFNWNYSGNITSLNVYDQDNKNVNASFGKFVGTDFTVVNPTQIPSGENIYVLVPMNSNVERISKIEVKVGKTSQKIVADVWTLSQGGFQNLITTTAHPENTTSEATLETGKDIQLVVKLSGYVWKDKIFGKTSTKNDLFKDNLLDGNDEVMDGIIVRLKDVDGTTIQETKTAKGDVYNLGGGEYEFDKVLISKLGDYYIEFEYGGLVYTNVTKHLDKNNGSKAVENAITRNTFNDGFQEVQNVSGNKGKTKSNSLEYTYKDYKSNLNNKESYIITSDTKDAEYNLLDTYKQASDKSHLKYINLGLYEREQPDIELQKDVQNAIVSINGTQHTYNYADRFKNQGEYQNGFNVGVKFENDRGTAEYTRPIYKSDVSETTLSEKNQLQVKITYRIQVINTSTSLQTQVNNVIDYYDSSYWGSDVVVGTNIENGNVTGTDNLTVTAGETSNGYTKIVIDTTKLGKINSINGGYNSSNNASGSTSSGINVNETAEELSKKTDLTETEKALLQTLQTAENDSSSKNSKDVYVQFSMNKEKIKSMLTDSVDGNNATKALENVAEVGSYNVYDSNGTATYAGIDVDSAPGNATPGTTTSYEDDTDTAKSFRLIASLTREITGTVFEDATTDAEIGKVREGDGKYDGGQGGNDKPISEEVEVKLTPIAGTEGTTLTTQTSNGEFNIADGYVPGKYIVTYTWGGTTYTVQDYKATVFSDEAHTGQWWTQSDRYSDATDDYATREKIDNEMMSVANKANYTINKMTSTTPEIDLGVEENDGYYIYNATEDTVTISGFDIKNLDFGIARRPKQDIQLTKNIKDVTVTLANGQILIDHKSVEDIKAGKVSGVTYMPASTSNPNGYVKIEIDNELIQGAKVEVSYSFVATNISEADYRNETFYKYGETFGKNKSGIYANPVTITPTKIVDYLDNNWGYEQDKNTNWSELTQEQLKQYVDESTVIKGTNSNIGNVRILTTDSLGKDANNNAIKLEPNASSTTQLNVSKLLTTSDDISLGNETEVINVDKTGGSELVSKLGNYVPGSLKHEKDSFTAETTIVTPPTGSIQDFDTVLYISSGIAILIGLAAGIIIIKKKAI